MSLSHDNVEARIRHLEANVKALEKIVADFREAMGRLTDEVYGHKPPPPETHQQGF